MMYAANRPGYDAGWHVDASPAGTDVSVPCWSVASVPRRSCVDRGLVLGCSLRSFLLPTAHMSRSRDELPVPYFDDNYQHLRFPLARTGIPGVRVAQLAAVHALSAHFFARKEPAI